jgi:hypothetical protein
MYQENFKESKKCQGDHDPQVGPGINNVRSYYDELQKACKEGHMGYEYTESFYGFMDQHYLENGGEDASNALYTYCESCIGDEVKRLSASQEQELEDLLYKLRMSCQGAGFNAGYEVGFNKGLILILRLSGFDKLSYEDLNRVIFNKVK